MSATFDKTWMWHPSFPEHEPGTAGLFLHFRKEFILNAGEVPKSMKIHITADTKYKLYVNRKLASFGPVKGDHNMWFFDEVDIGPYLIEGTNRIGVHILRFFFATQFAPAFPRLPSGGLRITLPQAADPWPERLCSGPLWETAIDPFGRLRIDEPEDSFLHIYEIHRRVDADTQLQWVPARVLEFKNSTGNSPPWHLSPRLIPNYRIQSSSFSDVHNIQSDLSSESWRKLLLADQKGGLMPPSKELRLTPGSRHSFELEAAHHITAFLKVLFKRPEDGGGYVKITYSESYEEQPDLYKGIRRKAHRCDRTKMLIGPHDLYHFQGPSKSLGLEYFNEETDEIFIPFHFRSFRFLKVEICVEAAELAFRGIEMALAHYPLDVRATIAANSQPTVEDQSGTQDTFLSQLWTTSIRTLVNCMHDCYEDCPFYEQLQYAMDTRSSALFTYCVSGDDALARQAIIQIHNSFQPRISLTASRAPTHRQQFIPTFSLYWICMLSDHYVYFGDSGFLKPFLSVVDGILAYFEARVDSEIGLVRMEFGPGSGVWNFVDWTEEWKPYGYPEACERTGVSTFINEIYVYTLNVAAELVSALGKPSVAMEYQKSANRIIAALREHCFDGEFFTDSITSAKPSNTTVTHSQHSQIWAVLSGALSGSEAQALLSKSMKETNAGNFVKESIAMSFYTLRALAVAGGDLYNEHFHAFWEPWKSQLDQGLTTWVEDSVAQRSDCHAWGSVPLYEFPAEVAGVRPTAPGWKAIEIMPRLGLYSSFEATVPLSVVKGVSLGTVQVSWAKISNKDEIELRISGEIKMEKAVPLSIRLPHQNLSLAWTGSKICLTTKGVSDSGKLER